MGSVAVLGSINMDLVVRVRGLPRPGDTVLGDRLLTVQGGKGGNQAVAAARLGASVRMIGRVGADSFGPLSRDCEMTASTPPASWSMRRSRAARL